MMEEEYISKSAALSCIYGYLERDGSITPPDELPEYQRIEKLPAADVRENRRGKWQITDAYPHNVYCSECHKRFAQTHWAVWEDGSLPRNFCPNCGADMRRKEDG